MIMLTKPDGFRQVVDDFVAKMKNDEKFAECVYRSARKVLEQKIKSGVIFSNDENRLVNAPQQTFEERMEVFSKSYDASLKIYTGK
jgi:hypothetical protein